jgi:hypothetical protein
MIGGALLMFFGLVGSALQRKRAAAEKSSLEQDELTDGQVVSLPKFLDWRGSRGGGVAGRPPLPFPGWGSSTLLAAVAVTIHDAVQFGAGPLRFSLFPVMREGTTVPTMAIA